MSLTWGNTATTPSTVPSVSRVKRYDGGDVNLFPTPANIQINPGDLVLFNTTANLLAIMSNVGWDTNILTTQQNASLVFLGVALGQKNAADPTNRAIPVITRGYASYPCVAVNTVYPPGTPVGAAAQGTHNLADQQVIVAADIDGAIGKVSQLIGANATELEFFFQSSLIFGEMQAA